MAQNNLISELPKSSQRLLATHTVEELKLPAGGVIEFNGKTPPLDCFRILIENKIFSAPVWDDTTGKYSGFIDIRDLVSCVVFASEEMQPMQSLESALKHGMRRFSLDEKTGITTTYLSRRNVFIPVKPKSTLLSVAKILSKPGVHRVPVVEEINGKRICTMVVSQSSLIKFLDTHKDEIKEEFSATLSKLHIGLKEVFSVKSSDPVINALKAMDLKCLSGIPIVDDSAVLVATTTSTDLKVMINLKTLPSLDMPMLDFFAFTLQNSTAERNPCVCCKYDTSLAKICGVLTATRFHRIYIVDDDKHLIGVVSFGDILAHVVSGLS